MKVILMKQMIEEINSHLEVLLNKPKDGAVKEAMKYSVMAGGKRLRPVLLLSALKAYGYPYQEYLDVACAIEMIHTYSLIHDDLPAMDNDDLRRGRPTCHKQFDEATAILAGDGLLNEAMNVIMQSSIEDHLKVQLASLLFKSSGASGMIYGQQQDMYYENHQASLKELEDIHHYKTGCLIAAPLEMAGIVVGKEQKALRTLGFHLGLAFQIQDDILDVTSDSATLGKTAGSDIENGKSTYVSLLGLEKSREYANELFKQCLEDIYGMTCNHGIMIDLLEKVIKRVN